MPLIEQILHLPVIAGALVLMGVTTLVGLLVYYLSFRFRASPAQPSDHLSADDVYLADRPGDLSHACIQRPVPGGNGD